MQSLVNSLHEELDKINDSTDEMTSAERLTIYAKVKAVLDALDTPAVSEIVPSMPPHQREGYIIALRLLLTQAEVLFRPSGGLN